MDIRNREIDANIDYLNHLLQGMDNRIDWIILPEMFLTGFIIDGAIAKRSGVKGLEYMREVSKRFSCAVEGSLLVEDDGKYFNRHYFITPTKEYFYDKKHLFSFSAEDSLITAGDKHQIINYYGILINILTCYDLRFPIWSINEYNRGKFKYDVLVYVASWPQSRSSQWEKLLMARAIENQSYIIGVNRQGIGGEGEKYSGNSMIVNPLGEKILHEEQITISNCSYPEVIMYDIDFSRINTIRESFPFYRDW